MTYRLSNTMPNQSRNVDVKKEEKKKFFFVIEGEKTESIYLQEVAQNVKKDALIDVLILERIQGSHSNQYKITATIQEYVATHSQLTQEIKDNLILLNDQYEEEELSEVELIEKLSEILGDKKESLIIEHNNKVIQQIRALNNLSSYEKDFDKICLILDRDYRSFKDSQYDLVLEICSESNFLLGITNPNFEFYLLLHLDEATSYDQEKIKRNPNVTSKKKYTEYSLNEKLKEYERSYKKNNYDANFFIKKYSDFKDNITNYSVDNMNLKDNIGSSVHHIINHLLD
ncbi:RloB family protein [Paenisporosarcina quisquiliarum]|uniref:RloB family protein n=1 Tax=Paenisporosarcina quisquiliarum TaxID=365346 RepID=A0A9X3LH35_9BACL|nr:RloB domain-containing protein [Paenisporosarcina quisquiliarum]MCZ8537280.1 RloB family protein [Paenisporosarcina quisquiliarum]